MVLIAAAGFFIIRSINIAKYKNTNPRTTGDKILPPNLAASSSKSGTISSRTNLSKTDETEEAKTFPALEKYQNEKFGFELQYPGGWHLNEDFDSNKFTFKKDIKSPIFYIQFTSSKYSDVLAEQEKNFNEYQINNKDLKQPTGEIIEGIFADFKTKEFYYYSPI